MSHRQDGSSVARYEADKDAKFIAKLHINLSKVTESILCAPNDPDDAGLLSDVAGDLVNEVFIGSCMTNIGHFRAAGKLFVKNKDNKLLSNIRLLLQLVYIRCSCHMKGIIQPMPR